MIQANNVLLSDGYTSLTTWEQPGTKKVNLYVYNAPVMWSFLDRNRVWSEDKYLPMGERSYDLRCRGVRVRNAVPGKAARVSIELVGGWD